MEADNANIIKGLDEVLVTNKTVDHDDNIDDRVSNYPTDNVTLDSDDMSGVPTKTKRLRKAPIVRSKDFLW